MRTIFKTAILSVFILIFAASARPQNNNAKMLSGILTATEISGAWQINVVESENPIEKTQTMLASRISQSANEKPINETNKLPAISISLVPPQNLIIENGGERIFTINEGFNQIVYTKTVAADGVERTAEIQPGVNLSIMAEQTGDSLKIETRSPRKNRMIESYALADKGKKLIVTVRFEDETAQEIITFRRVYDRVLPELFPTEPQDYQ